MAAQALKPFKSNPSGSCANRCGSHAPARSSSNTNAAAMADQAEPPIKDEDLDPQLDTDARMDDDGAQRDGAAGFDGADGGEGDGGGDAAQQANRNDNTAAASSFEPRIPAKKDATLREFLSQMDDYAPIVSPASPWPHPAAKRLLTVSRNTHRFPTL